MADVAQKYKDKIGSIKADVKEAESYWGLNRENFDKFMRFVFWTALTNNDLTVLSELQKPQIEANIIEAFISRLCGEFSKQEPDIEVMPLGGYPADENLIDIIQRHMLQKLDEANKNGFEYNAYKDMMGGGYTVFKVWTDYESNHSFNQDLFFKKVHDVAKVGFDPLAKNPNKDDGRYCYEYVLQSEAQFKKENPTIDLSKIDYTRNSDTQFNWAYRQKNEKVLVILDYYCKKERKKKLVQLSTGVALYEKQAQEYLAEWQQNIDSGLEMRALPTVIDQRTVQVTAICRYRCIADQVIEYVETDFEYFPLIFVSGNPVWLKESESGILKEYTRSYAHNAQGIQRFKNMCLQTLGNEIENLVQHKMIAAIESLDPKYTDAYTNIQKADNYLYHAFMEKNGQSIPLPPPQPVMRAPIPPEIAMGFQMCDQTMQMILGSFDASLGINNNQLSGVAIVEAATQSNAAAMPFIVGYMQGLTHLGVVLLSLFPKYYKTPRTIPIKTDKGKRGYVSINTPSAPRFDYQPGMLGVKVEAGVNFAIQKNRALQQIMLLCQSMPTFAQFINDAGLPIILDNMEIYGIDKLKAMAEQWQQQQAQMKQQAQAMASQQPNPLQLKAQELQQKAAASAQDYEIKKEANQNEAVKTLLQAQVSHKQLAIQEAKTNAENMSTAAELALKHGDQAHRHTKEDIDLAHGIMSQAKSQSSQDLLNFSKLDNLDTNNSEMQD